MTLLLDTNAFIWWLTDSIKLGKSTREMISNRVNDVYLSNLSIFECSIKEKLGKLKIDYSAVDEEISLGNIRELKFDTLSARQLIKQARLPHSDPFDSGLVAQAVSKHMVFVTSDENILKSTVEGLFLMDSKK